MFVLEQLKCDSTRLLLKTNRLEYQGNRDQAQFKPLSVERYPDIRCEKFT
jgi:hypothetical protein